MSETWLDAFNHRELEVFARYVADDFIGSTDDGIFMTKARLLKRLATHPAEQEQRGDVRDVRVHVDGDSAIVNYLVTVTEGGFESEPPVLPVSTHGMFSEEERNLDRHRSP